VSRPARTYARALEAGGHEIARKNEHAGGLDDAGGPQPENPPDSENEEGREVRVRRPADLLEAIVALAIVGLVMIAAHGLPHVGTHLAHVVARAVARLPRVLVFACAVLAAVATLAILCVLGVTLGRRRRRDGVNAIVAGVAALLLAVGLVADWHAFHAGISSAMLHGTDGSTFVRDATIVALAVGSDTGRYRRWRRYLSAAVGALLLTGLGLAEITPSAVVVAVVGGCGVGLAARWALHTAARRPSIDSLLTGLRGAGVDIARLQRPSPESADLEGVLEDGREVVLKLAGREVHGAGVTRRLWSFVRLRGAATGRRPISVRAALETEALASLMASNSGVLAPRILLFAHFEPDTAVLARERFTGPGLSADVSDDQLRALFASLRRLHEVGVAHRDLQAGGVVFFPRSAPGEVSVGFRSLESAVVGAGELVRRIDLAQLLTATAGVVGAARAVTAMRSGYRPGDEREIAAILQPVALSGWGWTAMHRARACLAEIRHELVGEGAPEVTETRLERFRWRTVALAVALLVAAYVVVGQLSTVNLAEALGHADWAWFGVAVAGSALTYLGSSINLVAFVPSRVSVTKAALVEVSGAFFGLVTPPTVGHVAINARFLHRQGVDGATTASAVGLSQLVNFVTTIAVLVVMTLLAGTGAGSLKIVPSPRLLGVFGGLLLLVIALVTLVPWTKRLFWDRVWPRVRGAWPQLLEMLSRPLRLVQGIGGNLLLTASYALALVASLIAVGAHPPIIATAAVFMAGNTVGAAAPTPGGLGAVEAVLVAGLTAVGIPAHDAIAGVLLFRLATFWLPILPGWVLFLLLQRRGVL
jgi:uncharacterized membrane protein YbhN (UPF0104 family)